MSLPKEDVNFQIVPVDDTHYHVRLLESPHPETVIRFDVVRVDGQNGTIKFNFTLISSPDTELTTENEELQDYSALILQAILEDSLVETNEGTVIE